LKVLVALALQSAQPQHLSAQVVVLRRGPRLLVVVLALSEALQRRSQKRNLATEVYVARVDSKG